MLKKVILYTNSKSPECEEIINFLSEQELSLDIRDIRTQPLTRAQIAALLRHFNLEHFLNPESRLYKKNRLDDQMPKRSEIYDMMAEDGELMRTPIIVSGRLMTVGCNHHKIMEMLQLKSNGSGGTEEANGSRNEMKRNGTNGGHKGRAGGE